MTVNKEVKQMQVKNIANKLMLLDEFHLETINSILAGEKTYIEIGMINRIAKVFNPNIDCDYVLLIGIINELLETKQKLNMLIEGHYR
jgi:hypothetical protein